MKSTQSYRTKQKSRILDLVKKSSTLMSASDIYSSLCSDGESLNLTTVYRNLDAMTREGVVLRFSEEGSGRAMYKYAGEGKDCLGHLHARCTKCGKLVHLDCNFINELSEHARHSHGFWLSFSQSILVGECEQCMKGGSV